MLTMRFEVWAKAVVVAASCYPLGAVAAVDSGGTVINVKDFGATCDGVTDDSAALNAAMAAARDGEVITLPRGRCRVSNLRPPKWTGNGGSAWSQITIRGTANAWVDDIFGSHNFGSTLYIPSPLPDVPVFSLTATRGIRFEHLNFVGANPPVTGSVAVHLSNYTKNTVFDGVTFAGWDEAVRIGTPGQSRSFNDDELTFRDCWFLKGNVAITNYGTESYAIRVSDSSFITRTAFRMVGSPNSSVMNSFKCHRCTIYSGLIVRYDQGSAGGHSGRDIIVLDEVLFEPSPSSGGDGAGQVFLSDASTVSSTLGLVVRDSTLNLGGDTAAVYDPAFRVIRYFGRGPFIFEGNKVGGLGRIPLEIVSNASGWNGGSLRMSDNVWTTARPTFVRPKGEPRPPLRMHGETYLAEPKLAMSDSHLASYYLGSEDASIAGATRHAASRPPVDLETWTKGSTYEGVDGSGTVRASCRQSGTAGRISSVTATLESGSDMATIEAGQASEARKIQAGMYVTIGASGPLEVRDVVGKTIYLHATWAGPRQPGREVAFSEPVFVKQKFWAVGPPTSGAWSAGDIAWAAIAGTGAPLAWRCTAGGSPGTWEPVR